MLALLELIVFRGELICSWRFFLAAAVTGLIVAFVYWTVDIETLRLAISIPVAVVGAAAGIIWQVRND